MHLTPLNSSKVVDKDAPVSGVTITFDMVEKIVSALKKPTPNNILAGELREHVEAKTAELTPELQEAAEQLKAIVG